MEIWAHLGYRLMVMWAFLGHRNFGPFGAMLNINKSLISEVWISKIREEDRCIDFLANLVHIGNSRLIWVKEPSNDLLPLLLT